MKVKGLATELISVPSVLSLTQVLNSSNSSKT